MKQLAENRALVEECIEKIQRRVRETKAFYLFGAGGYVNKTILWLEELYGCKFKVCGIFDNDLNKAGNYFDDIIPILKVFDAPELVNYEDTIVITNDYVDEIRNQLLALDFSEEQIISYQEYMDYRSELNIIDTLSRRNILKNNVIRVGFMTYEIESWDKLEPIYTRMKESEKFNTYLFLLPKYDYLSDRVSNYSEYNAFRKLYPSDDFIIYDTLDENFELDHYELDYMFVSAPYDNYVPIPFQSDELAKKVKICYIPYGYTGAYNFMPNNTIRSFFRNVYMDFNPVKEIQSVLKKKIAPKEYSIRKYFDVGYPALEKYLPLSIRNSEHKNILWTPRWSYDDKIGGSHFFEYYNVILQLKDIYPDWNLTIRPHPLMFDNFIKEKRMRKEDVERFKELLKEKNIYLDLEMDLYDSLSNADILISDFSSILLPFFLTGRPIVYCAHPNISLMGIFVEIMDSVYVVDEEQQIVKAIKRIICGDDKMNLRVELKNLIKEKTIGATDEILEFLINDMK